VHTYHAPAAGLRAARRITSVLHIVKLSWHLDNIANYVCCENCAAWKFIQMVCIRDKFVVSRLEIGIPVLWAYSYCLEQEDTRAEWRHAVDEATYKLPTLSYYHSFSSSACYNNTGRAQEEKIWSAPIWSTVFNLCRNCRTGWTTDWYARLTTRLQFASIKQQPQNVLHRILQDDMHWERGKTYVKRLFLEKME